MSKFLETKEFPEDYSDEAIGILKKMSFSNLKYMFLKGSMALRSQLYPSDFDGWEIIENEGKTKEDFINEIVGKFKKTIRELENTNLTYIMDIKCGEIEDWKILDDNIFIKNGIVQNYNDMKCKKNLEHLYKLNLIDEDEYNLIYKKLLTVITPKQLLELKDLCKFHIVRWKPEDILKGYTTLLDGSKYYLKEGLSSISKIKIDVVSWINGNKFIEISVNYQLNYDGKPINKVEDPNISYKESILTFYIQKNYFKMLRRIFSFSSFNKDYNLVETLIDFFNSDVGIINQLNNDVKTLETIIEKEASLPKQRIKFELDHFKNRLANIILPKYLKERTDILKIIDILHNIHKFDRAELLQKLRKLGNYLQNLLDYYTKKFIKEEKIDVKSYFP